MADLCSEFGDLVQIKKQLISVISLCKERGLLHSAKWWDLTRLMCHKLFVFLLCFLIVTISSQLVSYVTSLIKTMMLLMEHIKL